MEWCEVEREMERELSGVEWCGVDWSGVELSRLESTGVDW